MNTIKILLAGVLMLAVPVAANADLVTFSSDPTGMKANGWKSVESSLLAFTDSVGSGLDVRDYGHQSNGKALGIYSDHDDSGLWMDFDVPVTSLSLSFGNDDAGWSSAGDQAHLVAYLAGTKVGETFVTMNRNDVMDQSIAVSGVTFDKAFFKYEVNPSQGLTEVVDDIMFTPIPAPGAVLLGALGLGMVGWLKRRAKA